MSSQGASPLHSPNVEAAALPEEPTVAVKDLEDEPADQTEETSEPAPGAEEFAAVVSEEAAPVPDEDTVQEAPVEATEDAPTVEVPSIATEEVEAPEVRVVVIILFPC